MKSRLIASILMSVGLSFVMSFWVTTVNLGWNDDFLNQWLSAFGFAWPVACLCAFFLAPFVQKATLVITRHLP